MDTEERVIAETAQANQALGASGQSDMVWGHASIRDPDGRGVWMEDAGWSFGEVTADRVALVSPEGEVLAEAIGDGVGCLIPQHGLVTVGPDAATAVMRAVQLALACGVQLHAMAAGETRP